jgi:uncharacterized protein YbbK (DUF523 family)
MLPPLPPVEVTVTPERAAAARRPLRVGVSACLLGAEVRYDGGHKRDAWIVEVLGAYATFVPVCPEVEIGLGTPRPTIRLERRGRGVRLVEPAAGVDLTARMETYAARRAAALAGEDLDGYVLKSRSPSCGKERVKVREAGGAERSDGVGLFARALMARLPLLPVEEEGRLADARVRDDFVARLFAHRRRRTLFPPRWTAAGLRRRHAAEGPSVLAGEPGAGRALDRLVARANALARAEVEARYEARYLAALRRIVRRHGIARLAGTLDPGAAPPPERTTRRRV